jgi:hypothetical protein
MQDQSLNAQPAEINNEFVSIGTEGSTVVMSFHQTILKRELDRRCARNTCYSLRAFARGLRIDVAALSRMMAGKAAPTAGATAKILSQVVLTDSEREEFLASLQEARRQRGLPPIATADLPRASAHVEAALERRLSLVP